MRSKLGTEPATKGFKVLAGLWANTGLRVTGISKKVKREVRLPSDLKGLKIRVTSSKVEQQAFALTPGNPVSVDWAETYQAMQQGTVDALNVGLGPLSSARIQETIGTVTRIGMSFNAHVVVVSKRWFDALPSAVREAIDFLVAEKRLSRDEAYMLSSVAVDFCITQLVDGNKGVHGMIAKKLFR